MTKSTAVQNGEFRCTYTGCDRAFDSPTKLSMHRVRMHTHKEAGDNAGRTAHRPMRRNQIYADQSREAVLERKRQYNKRYRARLKQGLPGAGTGIQPHNARPPIKRKLGLGSYHPSYKRMAYLRQRERYAAMGLNAHGKPFKVGHSALRNIQIAQSRRRKREALEKRNGTFKLRRRKRVIHVWPPPDQPRGKGLAQPEVTPEVVPAWVHAKLHHCPACGEDLTRWKKE